MINQVRTYNFQSHKQIILDLCSGVNVIVGTSDSGKSALFRAMLWVITNKPLGDEFRTYDSKETTSTLMIDDVSIMRLKTASKNEYHMGDEEFKAFGQDIPEEIQKALNIGDINIQSQMDPPGWLFNSKISAGEVARVFNKCIDLTSIDRALSNIAGKMRQIAQSIKSETENLDTYINNLKEYSYLDQMETDVSELETLESKKKTAGYVYDNLLYEIEEHAEIQDKIKLLERAVSHESRVSSLIDLNDRKTAANSEIESLQALISDISNANSAISQAKRVSKHENTVMRLLDLHGKTESTSQKQRTLSDVIEEEKDLRDDIEEQTKLVDKLEVEFHKFMPDVCPLCDTDLRGKR